MKTSTRHNNRPNLISAVTQHGVKGVPSVYRRHTRQRVSHWLQVRYVIPIIMGVNTLVYALMR